MILVLALSMSLTNNFVYAEPLGEEDNSQAEITLSIDELTERVQQLDNKIVTKMIEIEELTAKIEETENSIKKSEEEIEEAEKKLNKQTEMLEARIRGLYKEGAVNNSVNVLVDIITSESLMDMIKMIEKVNYIAKTDRKLIEENNTLKDELQKKVEESKELKETLAADKITVEENLKNIEESKVQVEALLSRAIEEERLRQEAEEKRRQEEERIRLAEEERRRQEELNNAINSAGVDDSDDDSDSGSSGGTSGGNDTYVPPSSNGGGSYVPPTSDPGYNSDLGQAVIDEAMKYLGVDYVWGGTTPDGFDCSGLVQYVYRNVGISLPRVSQDQQNAGTRVSLDSLQPGDLIFWGSPAWHVAIYIGNNQYIHAPQTGDVVKISYLNTSALSSASRVF